MLEAAVGTAGERYDYNPDNWNLYDYLDISNVYCATYAEEISGYMAGYAAVSLNYVQLPMDSTQWSDRFGKSDYLELVEALYYGDLYVSDSIGSMPATTNTAVSDRGSIK